MTHISLIADCGPTTGLGHLRRLMVLADRLSARAGVCEFKITSPEPAVLKLISDTGYAGSVLVPETNAGLASEVIVYDGRGASAKQLAGWKRGCSCFVVLDDLADRPLECDIIVNPNIYGGELDYGAYTVATVLTGPVYNLVAPAFFEARANRQPQTPPRILISLGGTDDGQIGGPMARAILSGAAAASVDLVISPVRGAAPMVSDLTATWGNRISVHHGADMARLMRTASALVCGGGVTVLEGLAAGIRPVAIHLAPDQVLNIAKLRQWGVAAFAPDAPEDIAGAVIDGLGSSDECAAGDQINPQGADAIAAEILKRVSPIEN